jgi:hypothetical protein
MDSNRNYFHLSLLDFDHEMGCLREDIVSNNGDTNRVLSTVVHCMKQAALFLALQKKTLNLYTHEKQGKHIC